MQNTKLNKEMIKDFLSAYNQMARLNPYELVLSNKDTSWLKSRLQECLATFERCPTIAEVLQTNTKQTGEYETAWQEFKNNCCNNHKMLQMADWIFTMKELLGVYEVEEMTPETEKWVKKEFLRIIPSLRSGNIQLKQQAVNYLIDGNVTYLDDGGVFLLNEGDKLLTEGE